MKANLPQNEPKMLARWEADGHLRAHSGGPQGRAHLHPARRSALRQRAHPPGHALNKCLKDFIVKVQDHGGFDAPYVPGWDCHGLPIEIKVDEQLGRKKLEMDPMRGPRWNAASMPQKFLDLQRTQFKRIGVFGRWDSPTPP